MWAELSVSAMCLTLLSLVLGGGMWGAVLRGGLQTIGEGRELCSMFTQIQQ